MTVADDLEAARASLVMINPAPYNAEAPPAALIGDVTPTEMHYVRSNFAVPDHDGTLEIGGAVGEPDDPDPRRPARDARPRPHGHPRVRRQRPPGDAAAPDRRALGRLRRLHRPLDRSPAARGPGAGRAGGGRGRAARPGRRPRLVPPAGDPARDRPGQPHLHPFPAAGSGHRPGIGDPHRLRDERPTARARPRRPVPADRPALVRRRVREVAQAPRRPDRALLRGVPDRSLHLRVARPTPRARHPDAGTRPDHRPGTRLDHRASAPTRSAGRPGPAPAPSPAWTSASPAKATGSPRSSNQPEATTSGRTGASPGTRSTSAGTPCGPERPTPPATCNPTCPRGTAWATGTTPSRSSTSTVDEQLATERCGPVIRSPTPRRIAALSHALGPTRLARTTPASSRARAPA